jgi:hypothetical protein
MRLFRFLAFFAFLFPCLSGAATVSSTNFGVGVFFNPTNPILWGGIPAPAGHGTIVLGHFGSTTDAQIKAAEGNPAAWAVVAATFEQFGNSVTMGTGVNGIRGLFRTLQNVPIVPGSGFSGRRVYVAIGSGSTLLDSDQVVVFKSAGAIFSEPIPFEAPLTDSGVGSGPPGELLLGALGPAQVHYATTPASLAGRSLTGINAALIPEPTIVNLGILAFSFGILCRRRHRRSRFKR